MCCFVYLHCVDWCLAVCVPVWTLRFSSPSGSKCHNTHNSKISSHPQSSCQYIKPYNHCKVNLYFIFFTGILICPSLRSVFLATSLSPHSLTINIISHKIYNLVPKLILYNMPCFFNYPETFFNYIG